MTVILGIIILVVLLTVVLLVASEPDASVRARQLEQRVRAAERQIHDIGCRTRKAIIEEARRQQRQGWL